MGRRSTWPARAGGSERRGRGFHANVHVAADEAQPLVAHQRAGQKPRFAENLEAIANAQHQAARAREARDGIHHRRKTGDGAGAQVVAVRESAGQNDGVEAGEVLRLVPDEFSGLVEDFAERHSRAS